MSRFLRNAKVTALLVLVAAACASSVLPVTAVAQRQENFVEPRDENGDRAERPRISLQQARRIATSRYPGRVVMAVSRNRGGTTVHEIRIVSEEGGNVYTVTVDSLTGEIRQ